MSTRQSRPDRKHRSAGRLAVPAVLAVAVAVAVALGTRGAGHSAARATARPSPPDIQAEISAGPAAADRDLACSTFTRDLEQPLEAAATANDTAPLTRITEGEPAEGGNELGADAPYFVLTEASSAAASRDPADQVLLNDVDALTQAILRAVPGASLSAVGQAIGAVARLCPAG